jgi:hypothetical protein
MTGIFINYRRDDAPGVAGRLYDHLARSFSRRDLFIDVDAIKPDLDFVKQLDTQAARYPGLAMRRAAGADRTLRTSRPRGSTRQP